MSLRVAWDARLVAGTNTGDSTYWTSLLEAIGRSDDPVQLVLFSDRPRPEELPQSRRIEWRTVRARSSRWWSLVAFPLAVRRARAQVTHVQYSLSPLVRAPAITTVHDVSFFVGPEWFRPRDRIFLRATVPPACRRATRVLTVSNTGREEIERFIPGARGKVSVTFNACPAWIRSVPRPTALARARELLGFDDPFLLTVGTRWPRKNMSLAIQAAAGLPDSLPHRIVVTGKAGWGDLDPGPRGIATGYVDADTLSCLYSAAEMYLAPSRHEGFGIPLLEAFRCGCPVLCSTGGALPEVAGGAALVEPSWNAVDWTAALKQVLGDPGTLDALRKRGRAREREFTWEETARQTLAIYREVVK